MDLLAERGADAAGQGRQCVQVQATGKVARVQHAEDGAHAESDS